MEMMKQKKFINGLDNDYQQLLTSQQNMCLLRQALNINYKVSLPYKKKEKLTKKDYESQKLNQINSLNN